MALSAVPIASSWASVSGASPSDEPGSLVIVIVLSSTYRCETLTYQAIERLDVVGRHYRESRKSRANRFGARSSQASVSSSSRSSAVALSSLTRMPG